MMRWYIAFSLAAFTPILGGCYYYGPYGDDEFERYVQRKDGVTLTAGDAAAVNAATQMNHPWPYGVNDRRIFTEGSHAVRAIARYRSQNELGQSGRTGAGSSLAAPAGAPIGTETGAPMGTGTGAPMGTGTGAPMGTGTGAPTEAGASNPY